MLLCLTVRHPLIGRQDVDHHIKLDIIVVDIKAFTFPHSRSEEILFRQDCIDKIVV